MAENLYMMALSPTMSEGTIARWLVAEGAPFGSGAVLCEVETDKATMDYEAPKAGVLLKVVIPAGGSASVGETIAVIGKAGEAVPASGSPPSGGQAGSGASGPATAPSSSGAPGAAAAAASPAAPGALARGAALGAGITRASPLARAIAASRGLDLGSIRGSGPGGRVVRRDVEDAAASSGGGRPAQAAPGPAGPGPSPQAGQGPALGLHQAQAGAGDLRIPLGAKRAVIARRLSESFFGAPHYYLKRAVEAERLLALRASLNASRDRPLSLNAFLIKLAAEAIRRHPYVNSSWSGDSILQRGRIDIGLAVALSDGLITPVVRDCGNRGVAAIDAELSALIEKAKAKGLSPDEYEGALFTVSNLGSYGVEEFTAIINPPGSAILAVGALLKQPVVLEDGSIAARRRIVLTLGCDHRVIDGAAGAQFLATLAAFIEEPGRALA